MVEWMGILRYVADSAMYSCSTRMLKTAIMFNKRRRDGVAFTRAAVPSSHFEEFFPGKTGKRAECIASGGAEMGDRRRNSGAGESDQDFPLFQRVAGQSGAGRRRPLDGASARVRRGACPLRSVAGAGRILPLRADAGVSAVSGGGPGRTSLRGAIRRGVPHAGGLRAVPHCGYPSRNRNVRAGGGELSLPRAERAERDSRAVRAVGREGAAAPGRRGAARPRAGRDLRAHSGVSAGEAHRGHPNGRIVSSFKGKRQLAAAPVSALDRRKPAAGGVLDVQFFRAAVYGHGGMRAQRRRHELRAAGADAD